jgi:hypothetical protein
MLRSCDATFDGCCRRHGECVLRIVALQRDAAGLGNNLRGGAHHILNPVDTRIDGQLPDAGRTADDVARVAYALKRHAVASDGHFADTAAKQLAVLVYVADHNSRRREDEAVFVAHIAHTVKSADDVLLDLLHLRFLLVDLLEILLYAVLECLQQRLPFIKYISHVV